jgi:hypothetical protein
MKRNLLLTVLETRRSEIKALDLVKAFCYILTTEGRRES